MKQLCISDIQSSIQKKAEKRKESFNKVLEMCFKRIENGAKFDKIACFFDVPEFVIGYPLFDLNECIMYVYSQLVKNGFQVQYIFPRILYISWFKPDIKQTSNQPLLMHEPKKTNTPATAPAKRGRKKATQPANGKSVAEFKPSGKFILNLS